jgi:6,7-dimethyl-8-ribityllumazine synthase
MTKIIEGKLDASGFRFGIVVSRFNSFISDRLVEGALDALTRHGAEADGVQIVRVPGAYEIPMTAKKMVETSRYDAVSAEVSKGIAAVSLDSGVPVTFGVLTTDNLEQAIERAGSKAGNKGFDAAVSAIEMVNLFKAL